MTNGKHVFAYFGSNGLYCLDMKGNLIWEKDFGHMTTRANFGEGSSPALYGDKLVINWDHEGDSFIICLDKNTGEVIWRKDRDEQTSWSTPLIIEYKGKTQVVVSATNKTRSYDFDTGHVIWEAGGLTSNVIPTPLFANGIVYVASGFRGNALQAIDLDKANGDITGSAAVLWQCNEDTPYAPSPLLYNGYLYFLKSNKGQLTCLDTVTGKHIYGPEKLIDSGDIYASPTGAAERIYVTGRNGLTHVIKYGPDFEILAFNKLDDGFDASPVIIDDTIILRGQNYLYCIAEK